MKTIKILILLMIVSACNNNKINNDSVNGYVIEKCKIEKKLNDLKLVRDSLQLLFDNYRDNNDYQIFMLNNKSAKLYKKSLTQKLSLDEDEEMGFTLDYVYVIIEGLNEQIEKYKTEKYNELHNYYQNDIKKDSVNFFTEIEKQLQKNSCNDMSLSSKDHLFWQEFRINRKKTLRCYIDLF